ncbi:YncE family protein, partial [Streptomyces sp. NPDC058301]|uniref:YncE family protein n=1 Tax=Streptomyces sp. NPDC058301 TaxID=3346436 RepID=UPI0036E18F6A
MSTLDSARPHPGLPARSGRWFVLAVLLALAGALLPSEPYATAATRPISVGSRPVGIAVTPDGHHAYVANSGSFSLSVIDTKTNKVVGRVRVGDTPVGVAVAPDGRRAYAANAGSDSVSVIDTATDTEVATVHVGDIPVGVAVAPDGRRAY